MWDERTGGTYPRASARKGYASGRDSGPMGLGRTLGLDASHVDGPRHGGERRSVAINAGRTPSSTPRGCSPYTQPSGRSVGPLWGKTTDWRAGCGKSACPVRREGEPGRQLALPTPISHTPLTGLKPGREMWAHSEFM